MLSIPYTRQAYIYTDEKQRHRIHRCVCSSTLAHEKNSRCLPILDVGRMLAESVKHGARKSPTTSTSGNLSEMANVLTLWVGNQFRTSDQCYSFHGVHGSASLMVTGGKNKSPTIYALCESERSLWIMPAHGAKCRSRKAGFGGFSGKRQKPVGFVNLSTAKRGGRECI